MTALDDLTLKLRRVHGYKRRTKSGKIVSVGEYSNKVEKALARHPGAVLGPGKAEY